MKYPQLVSEHAVNGVSDWLESCLEQLGVDPPLVYTRLLLSLLHTPLQLYASDLAELADLKARYSARSRQRRSSDPQLLAVVGGEGAAAAHGTDAIVPARSRSQSLKRVAAIESIADAVTTAELPFDQIERLVDELCDRLRAIESRSSAHEDDNPFENVMINQEATATSSASSVTVAVGAGTASAVQQPQPEASRCYFKAFPALDKSVNYNGPVTPQWGGNRQEANNNDSQVINHNHVGSRSLSTSSSTGSDPLAQSAGVTGGNDPSHTKRVRSRRNRSGRGKQNPAAGPSGGSTWDTNFSGTWEMGYDLIREFVVAQNKLSGQSVGGSKVAIIEECCRDKNEDKMEEKQPGMHSLRARYEVSDAEYAYEREQIYESPPAMLCNHHQTSDYEETTVTDLFGRDEGGEQFESIISPYSRPLYQREVSPQESNAPEATSTEEEARYESKFNSKVADLWGDSVEQPTPSLVSFWNYYNSHRYEATPMSPHNNSQELTATLDFYEQSMHSAPPAVQYETITQSSTGGEYDPRKYNQVDDLGSFVVSSGQYNNVSFI